VKAQEARRVLDRLIGFKFSPKLSDLLGQTMAAGRVQSSVLKMMVDVEKKIKEFKKQKHYRAVLGMPEEWEVKWNTKPHLVNDEEYIFDIELATKAAVVNELTVIQVTSDDEIVEPPPPLTTAKLIKLCAIFFDYEPKQTMDIAQKLFEDGLITYHRTDSLRISDEAVTEIRRYMTNSGIPLPEVPIVHNKLAKRSQEAHEAIRPTDVFNDAPNLTDEQENLYKLIHRQVIGSQCRMAHRTITRAKFIGDNGFSYSSRGIVYHDRGFFLLLPELYMDKEDAFMPQLIEGDKLFPLKRRVQPIDTTPPKRFTCASLVEALEDMGIGRPSNVTIAMSRIESENAANVVPQSNRLLDI
jgi:DNA topoisomerase-1